MGKSAARKERRRRRERLFSEPTALWPEPPFYCSWCRQGPFKSHELTMDHLIPDSRGGPREPWNLVPSCIPCNSNRGNRMLGGVLRVGPRRVVVKWDLARAEVLRCRGMESVGS